MRQFLVVATLSMLAVAGCADSQQDDLQIELATHATGEAVIADVSITNTSDHTVQLLSWYLPDADLQEPMFQLTRDGQPVPYVGPLYKRAQPDVSDFITLAPGAVLTRSVDLARFYDLSLSGNYTIAITLDGEKLHSQIGSIVSPTVSARVDGHPAKPTKPPRDTCSADQHAQIDAAFPIALQYATGAGDYLGGHASATQRYVTWFGAFSSAGWDKAHGDYTGIATAFATQLFTFDCSCKQKNVYAFVNPSQPYNITLCGAFWPAPTSGTDSKAGTLVHETSHFDTTASTNDWAYGQAACMQLAQTDPTEALDNADSHEYFAENNPTLP